MNDRPHYPWQEGDALFADELNAAIAGAGPSGGPFLPIVGNISTTATTTLVSPLASHWTLNGVQTTGAPYGWTFDVADNLDARPLGALSAFFIDDVLGANAGGGRNGLMTTLYLTAPTRDAVAGPHAVFYNAIAADVHVAANQGGTAAVASACFTAFTGQAVAHPGATFINVLEAVEMGVGVLPGASVAFVNGYKVSPLDQGITPYLSFNAYCIGGALGATAGFMMGFNFGALEGGPGSFGIAPTGTLIGTDIAGTVAHGIDLSQITCTLDQFKGHGFVVDGNGRVTVHLDNAANDAAAATAGTGLNQLYRSGNAIQVRLT